MPLLLWDHGSAPDQRHYIMVTCSPQVTTPCKWHDLAIIIDISLVTIFTNGAVDTRGGQSHELFINMGDSILTFFDRHVYNNFDNLEWQLSQNASCGLQYL